MGELVRGLEADEAEECYRLRRLGLTERQIAETTGLTRTTVHRRLAWWQGHRPAPELDKWRAQELDTIQDLQLYAWRQLDAAGGHWDRALRWHGQLLALSDRRRKLLGLDLPVAVKVDATVREVTQADLEWAELLRETSARLSEPRSDRGRVQG